MSGLVSCTHNIFSQEMVYCYQNCSSVREKVLKFEAEGREFAKFLRSTIYSNSERSELISGNRMLF